MLIITDLLNSTRNFPWTYYFQKYPSDIVFSFQKILSPFSRW